jgi:hypothetical protein
MYTLSGSVVGAIIMTIVPELLSGLESSVTIFGHPIYGAAHLILSALMIVIIIFAARASWVQRRQSSAPGLTARYTAARLTPRSTARWAPRSRRKAAPQGNDITAVRRVMESFIGGYFT